MFRQSEKRDTVRSGTLSDPIMNSNFGPISPPSPADPTKKKSPDKVNSLSPRIANSDLSDESGTEQQDTGDETKTNSSADESMAAIVSPLTKRVVMECDTSQSTDVTRSPSILSSRGSAMTQGSRDSGKRLSAMLESERLSGIVELSDISSDL